MKNRWVRWGSWLLALMLAVTILGGCQKEERVKEFKLIGYMPNWYSLQVLETAPIERYTHINYAFAIPDKDGKILSVKYYNTDGQYYVGQWKNDSGNGRGILFYQNGNIKYEGDFVNGNFEGNGKLYGQSGVYYIGQFKNSEMHGKGIIYSKDGEVKYDGEFINNIPKEKIGKENSLIFLMN